MTDAVYTLSLTNSVSVGQKMRNYTIRSSRLFFIFRCVFDFMIHLDYSTIKLLLDTLRKKLQIKLKVSRDCNGKYECGECRSIIINVV